MTEREPRTDLSHDEEKFAERLAASYAPEPPSAARSQVFDAALRERIESPARRRLLVPALAATAAAAALAWALLPTADLTGDDAWPSQTEFVSATQPLDAGSELDAGWELEPEWDVELGWDFELFSASEVSAFDEDGDEAFLPEDYLAIDGLFLDG